MHHAIHPKWNRNRLFLENLKYWPNTNEKPRFEIQTRTFRSMETTMRDTEINKSGTQTRKIQKIIFFRKLWSATRALPLPLPLLNKFPGHHGLNHISPWCFNSALTKRYGNQFDKTKVMDQHVSPLLIFSVRPKFCFDAPAKENIACTILDATRGSALQAISMSTICPNGAVRRHARLSVSNIDDTIEFVIKNNADSWYPRPLVTIFSISNFAKRTLAAQMCSGPPEFPKRLDKGECFAPIKNR